MPWHSMVTRTLGQEGPAAKRASKASLASHRPRIGLVCHKAFHECRARIHATAAGPNFVNKGFPGCNNRSWMAHEYHWVLVIRTEQELSADHLALIQQGVLDPLLGALRLAEGLILAADICLMDQRQAP